MLKTIMVREGKGTKCVFLKRWNNHAFTRQMRQIQDIIATNDGHHLLILLTDGGVLYYRAGLTEGIVSSKENNNMVLDLEPHTPAAVQNSASLTEFSKLSYNPGVDGAWCLRRVGIEGAVVLLRATKQDSENSSLTLSVNPLSGMRLIRTLPPFINDACLQKKLWVKLQIQD
jgi:hypothetical protein